ncbi:tRNA pseudouridine(54/55) synthase Pus10 [Methanosphaera sp. ISO3-F5]|uniref:tRNA pseudouridine(54/55) synthase Pus10 n=1 Tax=Methanosphaera sp. ISO3-F5 TaxID=1452353 RepID=UPI002B26201D|nr:tRNA pseudouridine(54/55) synthase Pus10 [Methanosphaera sp. ISO3-F5]WQH64857.1 tRNA pseudouridine(54/55) synthase Pus10 [Methanosphaera sp. ISO3-F5]
MSTNNEYKLCSRCLARISRKFQKTEENEKCSICDNLLLHEDKIYQLIYNKIHKFDIEFNTFYIACQVTYDKLNIAEKNIHKEVNYQGNNGLKKQLRKDLSQMLVEKMGKTIDYKNPEVVINIKIRKKPFKHNPYPEINNLTVFIDSNPLFIEGKYRKLIRGIPQTKWPCTECKGKGCSACNGTGQQYPETVEGLIGKHLLPMAKGKEIKFHGSGREDIDVLMLGEGRPFVIEVKYPFKRSIDLKFLRRVVNSHSDGKIEINDLKFVDNNRRASIKKSSTESYKVYSAIAEFENGVTSNDIKKIEKLNIIEQRTPKRVEHRRADKIRTRKIMNLEVERINSKKLRLIIKCQGGLYIKELISGDEGRTQPSVSSVCKNKSICSQLDVLKVHIPQ